MAGTSAVDLYWLPLGAGGHSVRWNGRIFEAVGARLQHRRVCDLYHSALVVRLPGVGRFVIEQAPVPDSRRAERGVVVEGPNGARWAGRLRIFRYEVRCWRNGVIADAAEAVDSPQRLTNDPHTVRRLLAAVPELPTPVWGRDELGTGEMWNSNSIMSWLLVRAGVPLDRVRLPDGGRAPGWDAGVAVARRSSAAQSRRGPGERAQPRSRSCSVRGDLAEVQGRQREHLRREHHLGDEDRVVGLAGRPLAPGRAVEDAGDARLPEVGGVVDGV